MRTALSSFSHGVSPGTGTDGNGCLIDHHDTPNNSIDDLRIYRFWWKRKSRIGIVVIARIVPMLGKFVWHDEPTTLAASRSILIRHVWKEAEIKI
jgi:hypothetical protein